MRSLEVAEAGPSGILAPPAEFAQRPGLLRLLLRDRTAVLGLGIVSAFVIAAIFAPLLAWQDPNAVALARKFAPPSSEFALGADHLGRDLLSRLLYGARTSLAATAAAAVGISLLGLLLGMIAGYFGGFVDSLISRVVDILLSFPSFLLAMAVTGVLGTGMRNLLVAIVAVSWGGYARIVRGSVLAERAKPYVEAARALGSADLRILRRHLLPNIVAPVVVITTIDMGTILLAMSSLSFLGLGVAAPTPEWGSMLAEGKYYLSQAPQIMLFPGAAIFLMVLGFNLLGDGVRDVLDPRTSQLKP